MPWQSIDPKVRHETLVNFIYENPTFLRLDKANIRFDRVIFRQTEPDLLGTTEKKIDLIFVLEGFNYNIVIIEVKTGKGRYMDYGFDQIRPTYSFLSKNWWDWLDGKLKRPRAKDVYLVWGLVWAPIGGPIDNILCLFNKKRLGKYLSRKSLFYYGKPVKLNVKFPIK